MSDHEDYQRERKQIDALISEGYTITNILEDLDGAQVKFTGADKGSHKDIHVLTAEGRKYVGIRVCIG